MLLKLKEKLNNEKLYLLALALFCIVIILINLKINVFKYDNFDYGKFDLGNMTQMVWNTLHGRPLYLTDYFGGNVPRWSMSHVDPILLLFVPLFAVFQSPLTLVISQFLLVIFCSFIVFKIAKLEFKSNLASFLISMAYLFYPAIGFLTATTGFHGVTAVMPFFFASFYIFERMYQTNKFTKKSWILFWVMLVLTMSGKEQLPLYVILYGIFIMFFRSGFHFEGLKNFSLKSFIKITSVKNALAMIVIGSIWFVTAFFIIIPSYAVYRVDSFNKFAESIKLDTTVIRDVSAPNYFLSRYDDFGDSYTSIVIGALKNPSLFIHAILGGDKVDNLNNTFGPLGYLPIAYPIIFVFALPDLLINYMTTAGGVGTAEIVNHRISMIIPVLFISTIFAISMFSKVISALALRQRKLKKYLSFRNTAVLFTLVILLLNIKFSFSTNNPVYLWMTQAVQKKLLGSLVYAKDDSATAALKDLKIGTSLKISNLDDKDRECAQLIVNSMPANASVSGPDYLGAKLSMRETYAIFPALYKEADYVIVDIFSRKILTILDVNLDIINQVVGWLVKSDTYELTLGCGNLFVFKNVGVHNKADLLPIQERYKYSEKFNYELVNGLSLVDYTLPSQITREKASEVVVVYNKTKEVQLDGYVLYMTLINNKTGAVYQAANLPSFGIMQPKDWNEGRYYIENISLVLPKSVSSGSYKAFISATNVSKPRGVYLGDVEVL